MFRFLGLGLVAFSCLATTAKAADALAIARLAVVANHECRGCLVTGLEREKRQSRLREMMRDLLYGDEDRSKVLDQLKVSFNDSFTADDAGAEKLIKQALIAVYHASPEPDFFDFAARYLVVGLREGQATGQVPAFDVTGTYSLVDKNGNSFTLIIAEDYRVILDYVPFTLPHDLRYSTAVRPNTCYATYDFGYGKRTFAVSDTARLELAFPSKGKVQAIYKKPTQCLTKPQMYDTERSAGYWQITEYRLEGELKR